MELVLTEHADERLKERKIPLRWVEQVLMSPLITEQDGDDPTLEHKLGKIEEYGSPVLRVVCNPHVRPVVIITVHFDRSMKGKL